MSISSLFALFGTMVTLALIPSPSVMLVVARAMASGFVQGVAIALGILLGDFVFILLSLYSLAATAHALDGVFAGLSYLGAGYLVWLGIALWRSSPRSVDVVAEAETSWVANLCCGFLITIGDPKAILFYLSFFPAFVDVSHISILETGLILAIATIAVGGVKVLYAYLGSQSRQLFQNRRAKIMVNRMASVLMIATGIGLVMKA